MGYTITKVPCSVCGKDIANLPQNVNIGVCNRCEKLYCHDCFKGLQNKCPLCKKKLVVKSPFTKWPKKWQPLISLRSNRQAGSLKPRDFSAQLRHKLVSNKFCRSCHRDLQPDSRYCDLCGTKLKAKLK